MSAFATIDRSSARWLRLRAACRHAAHGIDLDAYADQVWATVEAFTNNNGRSGSPAQASAAAATGGRS